MVCLSLFGVAQSYEITHTYTSTGANHENFHNTYSGTHYTYVVGSGGCTANGRFQRLDGTRMAEVAIFSNFGPQEDCASAPLLLSASYQIYSNCVTLPAGGAVSVVGYDNASSYFKQALCGQEPEE